MRSNALRKEIFEEEFFQETSIEISRVQIAQQAERAANLPGNICGPDLEEFILQYSETPTGDFA